MAKSPSALPTVYITRNVPFQRCFNYGRKNRGKVGADWPPRRPGPGRSGGQTRAATPARGTAGRAPPPGWPPTAAAEPGCAPHGAGRAERSPAPSRGRPPLRRPGPGMHSPRAGPAPAARRRPGEGGCPGGRSGAQRGGLAASPLSRSPRPPAPPALPGSGGGGAGLAAARQPHAGGAALPGPVRMEAAPSSPRPPPPQLHIHMVTALGGRRRALYSAAGIAG